MISKSVYARNMSVVLTSSNMKNIKQNCLSVFDHFVGLALKGLTNKFPEIIKTHFIALKKMKG